MIKIIAEKDGECWKGTAEELILEYWKEDRTAFVGKVGHGPPGAVYLVCWGGIVLLSDPKQEWDEGADVQVEEFVDLEVIVKRREKENE